jgi:hypothetical protein
VKRAVVISTSAISEQCWSMTNRCRTRPVIGRSEDRRPNTTHLDPIVVTVTAASRSPARRPDQAMVW